MNDLYKLSQCREELRQAELAAWLHDIGKMSSKFIESHSSCFSPSRSGDNKWNHELVLRRTIRRIEREQMVNLASANKVVFKRIVEKLLSRNVDHRKKEFPNPFKSNFITNIDSYLRSLEIPDDDIDRIKRYFGNYIPELEISEDFFPNQFYQFAESNQFEILRQDASLADIIEQHGSPVGARSNLVMLFKAPSCDAIDSALDKGNVGDEGKQGEETFIATAFGFERCKIKNIDEKRKDLTCSDELLCPNRKQNKEAIKRDFSCALGETRRPANDVTLWDHSYSTGVLYRTLLVNVLLTHRDILSYLPNGESEIKPWRLLGIRTDGFEYITSISSIPDLLARKEILNNAFDRVQTLLEETYPLGLEVYRDENGSIFVVPDIENQLEFTSEGKQLYDHILCKFDLSTADGDAYININGEIVPTVGPLSDSWNGRRKLPPIGKMLSEEIILLSNPEAISETWRSLRVGAGQKPFEFIEQICTVCGLRPWGYGAEDRQQHYQCKASHDKCPETCQTCKAISRRVCSICEQRRADRSREWATTKLVTTLWTDEVADTNGRLALVVGCFDLTHWLSGDLVRTLTIRDTSNAARKDADELAKNPSFARLRRIWETTRDFWQAVCPTDEASDLSQSLVGMNVNKLGPRLQIKGKRSPVLESDALYPYHAYDLVLRNSVKMSVVWDPINSRFITADNLDYIDKQLNQSAKSLLIKDAESNIEEPTGYGSKSRLWGTITLDPDADPIQNSKYIPAIPILAEPSTFMALVPADCALKVASEIKSKYEREMGKVRNRLPLHLGIVYAHRRTPLRAILDAGRRMLDQSAEPEGWRVICVARKKNDMDGHLPERFANDKEGQFHEWFEVLLEKDTRRIKWYVPAVMGDGKTQDQWYPYVFLDSAAEPLDRPRRFMAPNPWTGSTSWLVHAADLKTDDIIYFTPATLDFQWLDSSGQRFEIAYDDHGHRRDDQGRGLSRRPYLLDELETLEEIWDTLKNHLSSSQIHALRGLIEAKREEWLVGTPDQASDAVFRQFCRDSLAEADWQRGKDGERIDRLPWEHSGKDRKRWLDDWTNHAVRGWLADVVELHMQIMKEDVLR